MLFQILWKAPRNFVDPFIIHINLVILRNMSIRLLCSPCSSQSLTRCRTGNKPSNFHIWTSEEMCKVSDKKLRIIDWTDLGGDSGPPIKPIPGMLNEFVNRCELATSYHSHQPLEPLATRPRVHSAPCTSSVAFLVIAHFGQNLPFLSRFWHFLGLNLLATV